MLLYNISQNCMAREQMVILIGQFDNINMTQTVSLNS